MRKIEESDKTLFQSKWIKILETERGYQYSERNGRDSVAIFLVRKEFNPLTSDNDYKVLVRFQPLPIDNNRNILYPCPITGGIEPEESLIKCALREVKEEAGYGLSELNFLGSYITGTQSNESVYMFWFDVTLIEPETPENDGTYFECISYNRWHNLYDLKDFKYSACQLGYYLLKDKLYK